MAETIHRVLVIPDEIGYNKIDLIALIAFQPQATLAFFFENKKKYNHPKPAPFFCVSCCLLQLDPSKCALKYSILVIN